MLIPEAEAGILNHVFGELFILIKGIMFPILRAEIIMPLNRSSAGSGDHFLKEKK